jgi:hypothetical protein
MAKHAGAHKAEKRRKELKRQKKQEEKRKKRLQKGPAAFGTSDEPEMTTSPESPEESQEGEPP